MRATAGAATLMVAAGFTVVGAPSAAADERASFDLTYGATYYRGTIDFYDRSVMITGELRGLSTGCRKGQAYAFRTAAPRTLDRGTTSTVCNGPVSRQIPLTADVAGGAAEVQVSLLPAGEERLLAYCFVKRGEEFCHLP